MESPVQNLVEVEVEVQCRTPSLAAFDVQEDPEADILCYCEWLTRDEVVQLARNAFAVAWLTQEERDRYLDALGRYAASGR